VTVRLDMEMLRGLPKTGPTDPIEFYRRPLVGSLYRRRIDLGLAMLRDRRFGAALEIGYGAGAVLMALAPVVDDLHGLDLDADADVIGARLSGHGVKATLVRGSVYELPYPDAKLDLVVCFSVFEHLHEYPKGLAEVARVLRPGGSFLLGIPAVNRFMEISFRAIGFKGIEDLHVTKPQQVAARFADAGFSVTATNNLDLPGVRLYYNWLLEKRAGIGDSV
jgi:ubiquinone/menaquinone biosynthesis C-methylase UbiE